MKINAVVPLAALSLAVWSVLCAASGDSAGQSKAPPPSIQFAADVMPVLDKAGCNAAACHGAAAGKGGLKLSLFGQSPDEDYVAIAKSAVERRINKVEPAKSLLLLKASGSIAHKGAAKLPPDSPHYDRLLRWVAEGALRGDDKAPRVLSLRMSPEKLVIAKGQSGQLSVTAVLSDGSEKDVTGDARYQSSEAGVAAASDGGRVSAQDYGQATILAQYRHRAAVATVLVPQPLPAGFPASLAESPLDQLVLAKLKELGIPPAEISTDAEFLRRAYLDVIGILPTPEEARAFLADPDAGKRSKLIDRLLARSEHADYWALRWGDLLRIKTEMPINLWPNAVQAYHRWVRDSILRNKPYDQFARELLTATGSNFRRPASNYYRALAKRDAQGLAETTALVFMGTRLECARCHVHPTEKWTLDDNLGMAAFFATVRYKKTEEWKEEIVYSDAEQALRGPAGKPVAAKFLDGEAAELGRDEDPRVKFADWLTAPQNPWFARNIVDRTWFWLMGRGIIHEPDDIRASNPPSNPELLAFLEKELAGRQYDLNHLLRLILNSRTYQRSSRTDAWNAKDAVHFSHYPLKRLGAEQLLDVIGQVTETSEPMSSAITVPDEQLPEGFRATQLADTTIGPALLDLFGRPPRATPFESDRSTQASLRQVLHLLNSAHIAGKIAGSPRIDRLVSANKTSAEIVEELYFAALSRPPGDEEKQKTLAYFARDKKDRKQAVQDLMWALLNTDEFLFNH